MLQHSMKNFIWILVLLTLPVFAQPSSQQRESWAGEGVYRTENVKHIAKRMDLSTRANTFELSLTIPGGRLNLEGQVEVSAFGTVLHFEKGVGRSDLEGSALLVRDVSGETVRLQGYFFDSSKQALHVIEFQSNIQSAHDDSLEGTHWKLVKLLGDDVEPKRGQKVPTLQFDSQGRVGGNSGCNRFGGSFTTDEKGQLRFGQLVSTRMMCRDMKLEEAFLRVLDKTDSYKVIGDTLELRASRAATLAVFERVSEE